MTSRTPRSGSDDPTMGYSPEADEGLVRLVQLLRDTHTRDDQGWTSAELAARLGIGKPTLWKRLHALGPRVIVGRRAIVDLAKRDTSVICYRLKADEERSL